MGVQVRILTPGIPLRQGCLSRCSLPGRAFSAPLQSVSGEKLALIDLQEEGYNPQWNRVFP